jgi:type IV pilus assembly protein PilV
MRPDPATEVANVSLHHYTRHRHGAKQRGFTLLEVLVALLVLSLGLLGLAGLQTMSLKFNAQSYQRTQATLLIDSMIDRMRANPDAVNSGVYNNVTLGKVAADYSFSSSCPQKCADADDLANYDIHQWLAGIATPGMLTDGKGGISFDGTRHTVTVTWWENDLPMRQETIVQLFPG